MVKEKFLKVLIATTCIISLIMPHASVVLAAGLTNQSSNEVNKVELISSEFHEGGAESSESLSSEEAIDKYDRKQYIYTFKDGADKTKILKVLRKDDKDSLTGSYLFSDAFYCLDGNASFPTISGAIEYERKIEDFFAENPATLGISDENYNSLCWILNNMYLRKQMTASQRAEQKNAIIKSAFDSILNAGYEDDPTIEDIKATLTDDDIEVMQQWAIWYFTNNGEETIQGVPFTNSDNLLPSIDLTNNLLETDSMASTRYEWCKILYKYFVNEALDNKDTEYLTSTAHPDITATEASIVEDGTKYKAGPFKVTIPTGCTDDYKIKITDGTNEIENYTINGDSSNVIPENQEFYVYIDKNSSINTMKLTLTYYSTKASVWTAEDTTYQPLVLVTREGTDSTVQANLKLEPDLALRKYIVKVNDTEITDRRPNITLENGKFEYKHKKSPVELGVGDTVTYEITVYNEGNTVAKPTEIIDYLPEGLEFIENNEVNIQNGWNANGNILTTTVDKTLNAFNKTTNNMDIVSVNVVCKVTNTVSGAILTNIAEIKADNIDDIDSTTDSISGAIDSIDRVKYIGHADNKTNLEDENYFYKGQEDDDDFEKVIVKGRIFDLSLQKFITKVNGQAVKENREPKVDVTPLKNNATNATYTTLKTPIVVRQGDIVTYKIRVYNEGEVNGYAESVADYLPEGLGYLVNYNNNINNYWAIPEDAGTKTVKLSQITNGTKNLKVADFTGVTDLNNVDVVTGNVKLISTALSSGKTDNLIKAFDGSDKLAYRDIEITCIVLSDSNLKNIAEITKNLDENKSEVTDRDSIPNTVDVNNYPGNDENQDDNDYEILTMKKFDLALQKFITGLNDKEIKDREPKIEYKDGKLSYEHPDTALEVNNVDVVTYTIRVYNEGEIDGYAAEVCDDIPKGLVFDSKNETNKKYGWKMYDSNGKETTDESKAVEVRTDYLSKEKSEARNDNVILNAFDPQTGKLTYSDVKVAFIVSSESANDTIINTAEITKDTDENGNEIEDIDSIPGNKKEDEDDIDKEKIHVGYFDLALQKDLVKSVIIEGDKTKEVKATNGELMKVEIHRKKINSTIVKFVYNITIKNEGTIAGYAKEIKDYIPEGLQFVEGDNKNWKKSSDNVITTDALANTLLKPGESASVEVVLRWINDENNLGMKTNIAEISKDYNDANDSNDIDSTPDNKKDGEDDIDKVEVILSISTGRPQMYILLSTTVLAIMSTGVIMIKKYVL